MNLHGIASRFISRVNPEIPAVIKKASGFTTNAAGKRSPTYEPDFPAMVQKQDLTQRELQQIDSINQQGILCSVYVNGNYYGVLRASQRGGDLFVMGGQTWKVVQVLEAWPDWCKIALVLQQ